MSGLIEYLKSFNRKERFILLERALGQDTFQLSDDFRKELACCLDLGFEIPVGAYVAMDYHIGWIQMAVYLENNGEVQRSHIPITAVPGVNDNQRDVDLLVAFTENSVTHLILIEAKADTSWDYKQLRDKVRKLKESIFPGAVGKTKLRLHFVLVSPKRLGKPKHINWADWMEKNGEVNHIPLCLAPNLHKITRWKEKESKLPRGKYQFYKIERIGTC